MQRLKHPVRSITEPFGKAGLTVAILALVMAMVGGAYAAGGLTKSQEKQVTKIAKKYAGKPGAPGANGTNGTNGTAGAKGDKGEKGDTGNNGTSVTGVAIPTSSPTCNHLGGTAYTSASGTENVCNGKTGFTETLPSGKTEQGTWATVFGKNGPALGVAGWGPVAVSFNIPLSAALTTTECATTPQPTTCQIHLIATGGKELIETGAEVEERNQRTPAPCPGSAAAPEAEPGNLCVYVRDGQAFILAYFGNGASNTQSTTAGVLLSLASTSEGQLVDGSWAVTAP